ncbi:50S ribosomal protein L18 [Candidatus Pacearchaeota archaeon CG10_big_fil_rev_8_21_14_0_10_32_14]|nr:MAG: 50S ribosomal protein L18 [Candidatus Pacearchaeota archaeon CG10_big_fil_rev_8_21_14_0_10_32_14]
MKLKRTRGKTIKRRRIENKTNYDKRLNMLKSGSLRIVFRKSNRYIQAQLVESIESQDKILINLKSSELMKYGWPEEARNSLKSLPASYLIGYLIGNKIDDKSKKKGLIVDLGMYRTVHKSKIYAFIKGLVDAGVEVTSKEDIFPEEDRIKGNHLKNKIVMKKFDEVKKKIGGKK